MPARPNRRTFLKLSTAAASVAAVDLAHAAPAAHSVSIVLDTEGAFASTEPIRWAAGKLRDALVARQLYAGHEGDEFAAASASRNSALVVIVSLPNGPHAAGFRIPRQLSEPETVALVPGTYELRPAILVTGVDTLGLVYGLLELADRVRQSNDPMLALRLTEPLIETTPNKVRSVARAFVSEVEDKPWFYDRAFWPGYLDTLAAARFNRFNFALGFGWDFPRGVTGDYLHFPYPYLLDLPQYPQVAVAPPLAPGERQRNLETLQFIAAETARRGMQFQLGLWTHAYEWTDSPHSDHHILGLTPETHARYCRDALAALLAACPQITGLSLRIHGESGIPEGSYPFWQTLFEAVPAARTPDGKARTIELDLHAKGLDPKMIDIARATGMPVKAGAKFWAEHQGLGYHQADIRATEYPREGVTGTFALSSGSRQFTRYGYGDFYQQGLGLELLYRVWPGTQRHLLWADPALAAGYGRAAHFCGASGMELCEPLTFKGREGSGHTGGRLVYNDRALAAPTESLPDCDTGKFALTYLVWGRHLYNPDTAVEVQDRYVRQTYGPAGPALGEALAAASRILPLITTAWLPSASNHELWVENYTPVSLLPYTTRPLYGDSPAPHNVSAISPLDPQLFTTVGQHARNLVSGTPDPRYNSSDVIGWLDEFVRSSSQSLATARAAAGRRATTPEFRRAEADILILNGLGTYFASLFRAALFYSIHEQTGDPAAATQSLAAARSARAAWAAMAAHATTVYGKDISYGSPQFRRGHWADRLPAIDQDLAALEQHLAQAGAQKSSASHAIEQINHPTRRPAISATHEPAAAFHPGAELRLSLVTPHEATGAILWYRHVNHAERWLSTPMRHTDGTYTAAVPAAYTDSPYPLQYYFELRTDKAATLYPGFNATVSNQPYYAIHKRA
jgi:hypothetical protein